MSTQGTEFIFSEKVTFVSFLAMIAVVLIHSGTISTVATPSKFGVFLNYLFCDSLTCWAVPFFFTVSGFFFAKRINQWSGLKSYRALLYGKFLSLVVPYLAWCLIGALTVFPLAVFSNHAAGRGLLERTVFGGGFFTFLDRCWLAEYPVGDAPLWYVRGLISIFIISPMLVWVWRKCRPIMLLIAIGLILYRPCSILPYFIWQSRGIGYFIFGIAFFEWGGAKKIISRPLWLGCGFLFLACSVLQAFSHVQGNLFSLREVILAVSPLLGIVFFWGFCNWNVPKIKWFQRQSFWIYCSHMIPVAYLRTAAFHLCGKTEIVALLLIFILPISSIVFTLVMAIVMNRFMPRMFRILTAARGERRCNKAGYEIH